MNSSHPANAVVAIYKTHEAAKDCLLALRHSRFDMKKLSIVGRGHHTHEQVTGFYHSGVRVRYWGALGAFWGVVCGCLFGSAFFLIPGMGPLIVAGPLVGWIIDALEGALMGGSLSALGACLCSRGLPQDSIVHYESSLKSGKYLVMAHGTYHEAAHARKIIDCTPSETTEPHALPDSALLAHAAAM